MQVGFIGLGLMGASMAANLQKAGHKLVVNDVRREAADNHIANGAKWAASPTELAKQCNVIFLSLPGPPEVEAVTLGENGLLAGLKAGTAVFDLSTNAPTLVRKIHGIYAEKGVHMLDSPVSGGPAGARSGRMAIWVGGDKEIFDKYKPLLDAMGDQARYIGAIGAGAVAKLVHNCAGYAVQTALAEVFTMGVKGGVEPLALWEAVRGGNGGRRRTFDGLAEQFLVNKYEPAAFALKLAHKDMTLATQLGRELGVPMRVANMAMAELTEALNRGWEKQDSRAPMKLQIERSGVKIEVDRQKIAEVFDRDPPFKG